MKKVLFTVLVLLSLLVLVTGTVSAAPPADGVITLVEVRNDRYGDVIFVFNVSGEFSNSRLNGSVNVQGVDANYGLHCSEVSDGVIHCTTSKKTGGRNVVVNLAGFVFWTFVPQVSGPAPSGPTQYCYNVYDVPFSEEFPGYPMPLDAFTTHCQDAPADYGDTLLNFYNPDWDGSFNYQFMPESLVCFQDIIEDAYYWDTPCAT